ncbi:hypothetical protein GCM10007170_37370 [Arthrobacter liuii]|uniref:Uncharacterized protein n=1 Tax=Arthrobacter liuii TaxID=1476996 RepID=A0ABQ2B042_9MICC|nr:hypothetical protein GCM10007170_37370 [Arthrobacter liuii]
MPKIWDDSEAIKIAYPHEWDTLPIQPPAGYLWRILRRLSVGLLAALGVMAIIAISSVTIGRPPEWLVSIVLVLIVVPGIAMILICVFAARPYRAERKLGYTTWPSSKELNRGG